MNCIRSVRLWEERYAHPSSLTGIRTSHGIQEYVQTIGQLRGNGCGLWTYLVEVYEVVPEQRQCEGQDAENRDDGVRQRHIHTPARSLLG